MDRARQIVICRIQVVGGIEDRILTTIVTSDQK
jgi:hypothetical protein